MNEKLKLNDGTEFTGHLLETDSRLFVYIYDSNLTDVFMAFNDPEKTKKIVAERNGETATVRGYKHLCTVSEESNGMVSASLKKG